MTSSSETRWAGGGDGTPAPTGGRNSDAELSHVHTVNGELVVFLMPWIESHTSMSRHPKTRRLARTLGCNTAQAIGHLHALWHWAMDYYQGGCLTDDTVARGDIADGALWDGDADQFVQALIACGWLDSDGQTLTIHDWQDYAGRYLHLREQNAERQRRRRDNSVSNAPVTRDNRVTTQGSNATVTREYPLLPNLTRPDQTRPDQELEDEAGAGARACEANTAHAAASPYVGMVADILQGCAFVTDGRVEVEAKVARAFRLEPRFQEAAGPREAELFSTWRGYAKKPPTDWYRAWLNWLKRSCDHNQDRLQASAGSTAGSAVATTPDERAREKAKYTHLGAYAGKSD